MFTDALGSQGQRTMLVDADGSAVSYAEMAARCADHHAIIVSQTGQDRPLALIECANSIACISAYLACLSARIPVILVQSGSDAARIVERYAPQIRYCSQNHRWQTLEPGAATACHPDLAVLLATSGSTGTPKLVRLSYRNIDANARAIADYLAISQHDRAITSLPFSYSFGLSVVHSHIAAGASLLVTDLSVIQPEFWQAFDSHGCTSFAGVPYSYELLDRAGFRAERHPGLKTLTQAGGRMPAERVADFAAYARDNDARLFVRYGQTEATARMAYVPADLIAANPGSIGVAIPGGRFDLVDDDGAAILTANQPGELVYSGPNVMMGYATQADDLALAAMPERLATGDIAQRDDHGLYSIVGRISRFSKLAGMRVGHDAVEQLLAENGIAALVTGDDRRIDIAVTNGSADHAAAIATEQARIPADMVTASFHADPPRLANGKPDYAAIRQHGDALARDAMRRRRSDGLGVSLARALGRQHIDPAASFASLGGDSLNYIQASLVIEKALGTLPPDWETMPVADLERLVPHSAPAPTRWFSPVAIETETLVRFAALMAVIIGHAAPLQTEWLRGGALVLLMMAGYSFARFQRPWLLRGEFWQAVSGTVMRVVIPYYLVMLLILATARGIEQDWGWLALLSTFTVDQRGPLFAFWFIEVLLHSMAIIVMLLSLPSLRRFAAASPFASWLCLMTMAAALKFGVPMVWSDNQQNSLTVDAWFYAYATGWGLWLARTWPQKAAVIAFAAALAVANWGPVSSRPLMLVGAIVLLATIARLWLPRLLATAVKQWSAAAYFIYLAHVIVIHIVLHMAKLPLAPWQTILLVIALAAISGLIGKFCWGWLVGKFGAMVAVRSAAPQGMQASR